MSHQLLNKQIVVYSHDGKLFSYKIKEQTTETWNELLRHATVWANLKSMC